MKTFREFLNEASFSNEILEKLGKSFSLSNYDRAFRFFRTTSSGDNLQYQFSYDTKEDAKIWQYVDFLNDEDQRNSESHVVMTFEYAENTEGDKELLKFLEETSKEFIKEVQQKTKLELIDKKAKEKGTYGGSEIYLVFK